MSISTSRFHMVGWLAFCISRLLPAPIRCEVNDDPCARMRRPVKVGRLRVAQTLCAAERADALEINRAARGRGGHVAALLAATKSLKQCGTCGPFAAAAGAGFAGSGAGDLGVGTAGDGEDTEGVWMAGASSREHPGISPARVCRPSAVVIICGAAS